eukprot:maker-scaffold_16-snap-gene-6.29-mRNA-1 protein AED:0.01 eAED:0.01 QI:386/1/1/1/1/1/2/50/199
MSSLVTKNNPAIPALNLDVKITNVVASFKYGVPIDLRRIAVRVRNAEFNPQRYSAVIMRLQNPKSTALIFRTGAFVITGTRSEEQAKLAARKFTKIVQKVGIQGQIRDFKISNMVGLFDCKFPIRLETFALEHGHFAHYEPEVFAGMVYKLLNPKATLLIFVSGKVVITGAKYKTTVLEAIQRIYPTLRQFGETNKSQG